MRGFKKFLFRNSWHVYPFFFKRRILKFKRTKWKKINSKIRVLLFQKSKFVKFLLYKKAIKIAYKLEILKFKILKFQHLSRTFILFIKRLTNFLKSRKFKIFKNMFKRKFLKFKLFLNKNKRRFIKKCFKYYFISSNVQFSYWRHTRKRFIFKTLLLTKATILKYFFGCFSVKFFKRQQLTCEYLNDLAITFINPELRIDLLLWRLKFFKSPYLARFAFQNNFIKIKLYNTSITLANILFFKKLLKGGDVVEILQKYIFRQNLKNVVSSFFFPSFIEIDYYLSSFVLLKTNKYTQRDITSVLKEPLNMYQFRNFLK